MSGYQPHGTVDQEIAQMGELANEMNGHITGADVIAECTADGHRYEVKGLRWEPSMEHPEGRLILVLSDCVHYSEDCDRGVAEARQTPATT